MAVRTIFANTEELYVGNRLLILCNELSQQDHIDDGTLVQGLLAAAALYSHYAVNNKQFDLFTESDRDRIVEELKTMLDQLVENAGQPQYLLPN